MVIPDSTADGIRRLRERGNAAFLCSGRSRAAIRSDRLFALGFDGVLAGCGTHIEYGGKLLFEKLLSPREVTELLRALDLLEMPVILEGPRSLYADSAAFAGDRYIDYLRQLLGEDLRDLKQLQADSPINKMSAVCRPEQKEQAIRALAGSYELVFHSSPVVEILPKGFSKASGIRWICRHLNIEQRNTFAFGDNTNDLEMLRHVQTGIAMGNGTETVKKAADYITAPVNEDGVWKALSHFGLI